MDCIRLLEELNIRTPSDFRKWALVNHPDKGGDPELFKKVLNCKELSISDRGTLPERDYIKLGRCECAYTSGPRRGQRCTGEYAYVPGKPYTPFCSKHKTCKAKYSSPKRAPSPPRRAPSPPRRAPSPPRRAPSPLKRPSPSPKAENLRDARCECVYASGAKRGQRCTAKYIYALGERDVVPFCGRHRNCKTKYASPRRSPSPPKRAPPSRPRAPSPARSHSPPKRTAPKRESATPKKSGQCHCIYSSGANKGTRCSAAAKNDTLFCGRHKVCKKSVLAGTPRASPPRRSPSPSWSPSPPRRKAKAKKYGAQCKCKLSSGANKNGRCTAAAKERGYCLRHAKNCKADY